MTHEQLFNRYNFTIPAHPDKLQIQAMRRALASQQQSLEHQQDEIQQLQQPQDGPPKLEPDHTPNTKASDLIQALRAALEPPKDTETVSTGIPRAS